MPSLINELVLVLNRFYLAVQVTEAKDAICALVTGKAKVIDEDYTPYTFSEWERITNRFKDSIDFTSKYPGTIRSPSIELLVPQVIAFPDCEYTSPLIKSVKYSRKNIFQRDSYTCQYCNKKTKREDLTIDHIVPRSRGGSNNWKNVVASCIFCNAEKGDKLLTELGWKLIQELKEPRWRSHIGTPFTQVKRSYWERFLK